MAWKIKIEGSAESGGTLGKYTCSRCGKSEYATLFPRYFFDEKQHWHHPNFCPWCGADNREHEDGWTIAEVIRENMTSLIHSYEENKDDPDIMYWCDEYGGDYLYGIDCHVVFQGEPPCLLDERGLSFDPKDSKERIKRDEACAECKAIWLMGKYE